MGMFMKTLRMTVSVFSLILAFAVSGSAQTNVFVTGNTSFTVTWQGVKPGATLLASATFTVSDWSGTSFKMTVTNVRNAMPTSPDINGRLTAFGFGLTPEGQFSNLVPGNIYQWAFTNFPVFQRVDVCLMSGGGCAGGGSGGLNQGQSTPDSHSITIMGSFTNGVTITPIPAKFQTSLGSLETDGVVVDQPQVGASDLNISKTHSPGIAIPGETVTYTVTVANVGDAPSSGTVTVTETPPTGLTVTALSGVGWTCTVATRTCTRSDALAPGLSYSPITVTTTVAASAAPGTVTNTAVVSGGGDSNSTNNTASDPTIIAVPNPGMDLTITKTHSPNTVVPGQTFTYFVTVLNVGSAPSSGTVTVTETPPTGVTITALSGAGWMCTVPTCTRSDALAPTASYPAITVTASVGASVAPGTVTNSAVVSGGGDPNTGNNTATDPTVITSPVSGADLTLTKTQTGGVVMVGQSITFTLRVTNIGDLPTSGQVTVTEVPPPGLTVTALSGSGWTCIVATQTCIRPDALAPTMSYPDITVTATIEPNATGTLANRAVVSGGGDSNPGNSTGSSPITIITPPASASDLTIAKTHSPSSAAPGGTVTYTVTVSNVGNAPSSGPVTVIETPPAGLTITALSGTGWSCTVPTCTRSDALAPGASYPAITVTTSVGASAAPGTVANIAAVSGGGDPNEANNTASDPTIVTSPTSGSDLSIAKTHSPSSVAPGQTVTYTVTVTNVGNAPSSGTVTVTETPPPGLTITALSGGGWTCTLATQTCTRSEPLAPGVSYSSITVTMSVGASAAPGTVTNVAGVSVSFDPNATNNTASDPTIIAAPVPALPFWFLVGLMSALLAIALLALRARRT